MGTLTTSSIGYGNDQCNLPGASNAFSPSPSGLPNRRTIARSCGPTVKNPEPRNTSTRSTITNLTIAKLLRSASASAWEPASTGVSGGAVCSLWGWSWSFMAGSLVQQVGRDAPEQVKRRSVLIKDENRVLLQRAFQGGQPEDEAGQFRILLEDRQRFGGLSLALSFNLSRLPFGIGQHFRRLPLGVRTDPLRLRFAFILGAVGEHFPLGGHALEHRLGDAFRQLQPLDAQELDFQAQVIGAELRLDGRQDLFLDGNKTGPIISGRNKVRQRVLAHNRGLGVAQPLVQERLCRRNRIGAAGESGEEGGWVRNLPADIDRSQEVKAVLGKALGKLVLEILHAPVEPPDLLDGPRPLEIQVGLGNGACRVTERGDDGDLGGADLKSEQQQAEDNDQQQADY